MQMSMGSSLLLQVENGMLRFGVLELGAADEHVDADVDGVALRLMDTLNAPRFPSAAAPTYCRVAW